MKLLFRLALVLLAGQLVFAETIDLSFDELQKRLEMNNDRLQAARLQKKAAEKRSGSLARSFMPSLHLFGATETFKKGREEAKTQPLYGAEAELNLFNGGRDLLESRVRKEEVLKVDAEEKIVRAEELAKARTLYWNALFLQETIKLIEKAMQTNEKNLNAANRRIQSGMATNSDRFEFQMQSIELKRELSELKLKKQLEMADLALLIGAGPEDQLKLPEQLVHEHEFEKLIAHSEEDHDFLVQQDAKTVEIKKLQSRKNARWWWPQVNAFATYNQYNQREEDLPEAQDRTESVVGLRLKLDLSSGFENQYESAALKYEAQALQKAAEFKRKEVDFHLHREISELKFLHEQLHQAEENVKLSEKYDLLTQDEYRRGVKNSLDLLSSAEKKYEIEKKYLEMIRDFQIAKSHILAKLGR